jgi:hypothetical protein
VGLDRGRWGRDDAGVRVCGGCVCGGVYKLTAFFVHVLFLGREGERERVYVLGWAL